MALSGDPGFDNYPYGLNWYQSDPSSRFANVIFNVPTASDMVANLNRAVELNAGYVYITDQTLPNPYAQLPSYWDQEVSAIASIPEPGSLTLMLAAVGLFGMAELARRRFGNRAGGPR
jgi:PEP-CTERM motif